MNVQESEPVESSAEPFTGKLTGNQDYYTFNLELNPKLLHVLKPHEGQRVEVDVIEQTWDLEEPKDGDTYKINGRKITGVLVEAGSTNLSLDVEGEQAVTVPFYNRRHVQGDYETDLRVSAIHVPNGNDILREIWETASLTPEESNMIIKRGYEEMQPDDNTPDEILRENLKPNTTLWQMAHWYDLTARIIPERIAGLLQHAISSI